MKVITKRIGLFLLICILGISLLGNGLQFFYNNAIMQKHAETLESNERTISNISRLLREGMPAYVYAEKYMDKPENENAKDHSEVTPMFFVKGDNMSSAMEEIAVASFPYGLFTNNSGIRIQFIEGMIPCEVLVNGEKLTICANTGNRTCFDIKEGIVFITTEDIMRLTGYDASTADKTTVKYYHLHFNLTVEKAERSRENPVVLTTYVGDFGVRFR